MTEPDNQSIDPSTDGLTVAEVRTIAGAVAAATATGDGLTGVQRAVLNAMCEFLLGLAVDLATVDRVGPEDFARAMSGHDPRLIQRIVQAMLVGELLLFPIPREVCRRVEVYAAELGIDDDAVGLARDLAQGAMGMAMIDFERGGYFHRLGTPAELGLPAMSTTIWERHWDDPPLAGRWQALEACPPGSLGLAVWRFYVARGFAFPGTPHSAPPLLAQHDWIHVLADYGSAVESEIEVFGLIARATPDFGAFSLLAMVLNLFETGAVAKGAGGFFERDAGHISRDANRMGIRLGDAMSRGKRLARELEAHERQGDADLLAVDWFAHAEQPVDEVRRDFYLPEKSRRAIAAGSVGPWEPGGISEYQVAVGQQHAERPGDTYNSWGATPRSSSDG